MDRVNFGTGKKSEKSEILKSQDLPVIEAKKDTLNKLEGDKKLNNNNSNKLNLDNKLDLTSNIKSSKDLKNVVLFGDKNERAEKELKSIAANTLKAIATAVDPTLGALEYIARNDILSKFKKHKNCS